MAEVEHRQAVVVLAPLADLLAPPEDGNGDAVERALHGGGGEAVDAGIQRGVPGGGEAFRAGLPAEMVGAFRGHADGAGGVLDRAEFRERGDEALLPLRRPAVVAVLAGNGGEVERLHVGGGEGGGAGLARGAAPVADDGLANRHGQPRNRYGLL